MLDGSIELILIVSEFMDFELNGHFFFFFFFFFLRGHYFSDPSEEQNTQQSLYNTTADVQSENYMHVC